MCNITQHVRWKINLSRYYDALSKAGYDKKDLKKLEDLAKNEAKFEDVCKKVCESWTYM